MEQLAGHAANISLRQVHLQSAADTEVRTAGMLAARVYELSGDFLRNVKWYR
jgi:hypothetical protein